MQEEKFAMEEYHELAKNEEASLRLKSRTTWLKCGNKNNKFFHTIQIVRNSIKSISALEDNNGDWILVQTDIMETFEKHFSNVFIECHNMQGVDITDPKRILNRSTDK